MPDPATPNPSAADKAQPFFYTPATATTMRAATPMPAAAHDSTAATHAHVDPYVQKAYERGLGEGKALGRAELEKSSAALRTHVAATLENFAKQRSDYFGRVEPEVVRLALSIARKILHRESQIDPMVLTGVVRVALQKLNGETRITLRTHPSEVAFWVEYFQEAGELSPKVNVVGDPALELGQCALETDFGTTEISLDAQLKEIEQGFFDLLEQRPKGTR